MPSKDAFPAEPAQPECMRISGFNTIGLPTALLLCLVTSGCVVVQAQKLFGLKPGPVPYEEVTFEDLSKRYLDKSDGPWNEVEGIYSVSCVIIRKGKGLLSDRKSTRLNS